MSVEPRTIAADSPPSAAPLAMAESRAGGESGVDGRSRLASLDQFRGYTVVGMLLVNFIGGFAVVPAVLKHRNTYCSYADTIMPQFFFAVGFAYRLTFLRRRARDGAARAYRHAITRSLGLILIGLVVYGLDGEARTWDELRSLGLRDFFTTAFRRNPFQALVHIGLTALWITPVIAASWRVRALFAFASAGLHLALSAAFYLDLAWTRPVIDGGPLGFLTWTLPTIAGTLAYDLVAARGPRRAIAPMLAGAVVLMVAGYGLSCLDFDGLAPPPFVPPPKGHIVGLWTMSQRTGSVSYLAFSTGFSLAVFALFAAACDLGRLRIGLFRTFGTNALAAYVLHGMVDRLVSPYAPRDARGWYVAAAFALYFGVCWLLIRGLEKQGILIRL